VVVPDEQTPPYIGLGGVNGIGLLLNESPLQFPSISGMIINQEFPSYNKMSFLGSIGGFRRAVII